MRPEGGGPDVFVHFDALNRARTTDTKARPNLVFAHGPKGSST
ncbi:hypothetical protein [Bradyrhizobium vignae]